MTQIPFTESAPFITDPYPQFSIEKCQKIANQINLTSNDNEAYDLISELFKNQPLINHAYNPGQKFWRGRPCKNKEFFIEQAELLWPPNQERQRANNGGSNVLYASTHPETIFAEFKADAECQYQIISIEAKNNTQTHLLYFGELTQAYRSGQSPTANNANANILRELIMTGNVNHARGILYVDAYAAAAFNDGDNHRLSSLISDYIFQRLGILDGVVYPSVKRLFSQNIALRPSSFKQKYRISGCAIAKVTDNYGYGIYDFKYLKTTEKIENQKFIWLDRPLKNPKAWLQWVEIN